MKNTIMSYAVAVLLSTACSAVASSKMMIDDAKVSVEPSYQMPQQTFPQAMEVVEQPNVPDYAFNALGRKAVYDQLMGHADPYFTSMKQSKTDSDTLEFVEKNIKSWIPNMISIARMMFICSHEMKQAIYFQISTGVVDQQTVTSAVTLADNLSKSAHGLVFIANQYSTQTERKDIAIYLSK